MEEGIVEQPDEFEAPLLDCTIMQTTGSELVIVDGAEVENTVIVPESAENSVDSVLAFSVIDPSNGVPIVQSMEEVPMSPASHVDESSVPDVPTEDTLSESDSSAAQVTEDKIKLDGIEESLIGEQKHSSESCVSSQCGSESSDRKLLHSDSSKSSKSKKNELNVRRSSRIRQKQKEVSPKKSSAKQKRAQSDKSRDSKKLGDADDSETPDQDARKTDSKQNRNSRTKKSSQSTKCRRRHRSGQSDNSLCIKSVDNVNDMHEDKSDIKLDASSASGKDYIERTHSFSGDNFVSSGNRQPSHKEINSQDDLSSGLSNITLENKSDQGSAIRLSEDEDRKESPSLKPEKVKSRWRRTCELEHSECSTYVSTAAVAADEVGQLKSEIPSEVTNHGVVDPISVHQVEPAFAQDLKFPVYEEIEKNIFTFERKKSRTRNEFRRMVCDCTLSKEEIEDGAVGCDGDCLNRLLMIECGSRCPTGDVCSNKRFQKRQYAKVEAFKTAKKGWGLRVLEDTAPGSFIIEYLGEVLNQQGFKQRVKQYAKEKCSHYYFMALKSHEIIDATFKGNLSRFINHSCDPNCVTQKWTVNGELRIGFFAKKSIKSGEEVTFDYALERYGREAQKCYCESENCTGFIGEANDDSQNLESSSKMKRKRSATKKKTDFGDLTFDEEFEKLCAVGSLRNREQTLLLARLMVRAEDSSSRLRLLDVILDTTESACLRLFLDYHGLPLLWSWMVDVSDWNIKAKILKVLSVLPIPNKTMLLDSKVLGVVQKWALEVSQQTETSSVPVETNKDSPIDGEDRPVQTEDGETSAKKQKSVDGSDSETDGSLSSVAKEVGVAQPVDLEMKKSVTELAEPDKKSDNSTESPNLNDPGSASVVKSDEDSTDNSTDNSADATDNSERAPDAEVQNVASELLKSWDSLKEVFRIPRLEKQKREHDEQEADRPHSYSSDYAKPGVDDYQRNIKTENHGTDEFSDTYGKPGEIPVIRTEKRFKSAPYAVEQRPRRVLLPSPKILTKEEKRQLFAMQVQKQDEEALQKQNQANEYAIQTYPPTMANQYMYAAAQQYPSVASAPCAQIPTLVHDTSVPPPVPINVPPPGYAESVPITVPPPNYADTSYPPPNLYQHPPPQHTQVPYLGAPPPTWSQPPPSVLHTSVPPPTAAVPGAVPSPALLPTPTANPQAGIPSQGLLPTPTQPVGIPSQGLLPTPVGNPQTSVPAQPIPSIVPSVPCLSGGQGPSVPPSGTLPTGGAYTSSNIPPTATVSPAFVPTAQSYPSTSHPVYYVPPTCSSGMSSEQVITTESVAVTAKEEHGEKVRDAPVKLPPLWRSAKDAEGNIYYYHSVTRQTQWDPPDFEAGEDEMDDAEDDGTPTLDEPGKRKSTRTAAADTSLSPEVTKKIKELFRTKMSAFVVQCLNVYRKPDCPAGRITSTEDFKHLARKLTHFVMAKEMKHCKNIEELECSDNVKRKAKDFILKYMSKFGPNYHPEGARD